jgi:hypothetical protein
MHRKSAIFREEYAFSSIQDPLVYVDQPDEQSRGDAVAFNGLAQLLDCDLAAANHGVDVPICADGPGQALRTGAFSCDSVNRYDTLPYPSVSSDPCDFHGVCPGNSSVPQSTQGCLCGQVPARRECTCDTVLHARDATLVWRKQLPQVSEVCADIEPDELLHDRLQ